MEYSKPNGYKNINTSLALFSSNMQDREERLIQRIQELELKNKKLIDENNTSIFISTKCSSRFYISILLHLLFISRSTILITRKMIRSSNPFKTGTQKITQLSLHECSMKVIYCCPG